jgi:glycosyltransferase involved in cell wall biosynthesis
VRRVDRAATGERKPVVCHLIERLSMGGAETLLFRLASGQRGGRYQPIVCSLQGGPIQTLLEQAGIPVVTLETERPSVKNVPRFLLRMTSILKALSRTFRDREVDVIHAHMQDSNLLAALVGAYCDTAVVGTYHGLGIFPAGRSALDPRNRIRKELYRLAGRLSDCTIAVSPPVRERLCSDIGLSPDKTILVLNGVDTAAFSRAKASLTVRRDLGIGDQRRIVVCVGRLIPAKNQSVLIRAMGRVVASFPEAALLLVGDGPSASDLRAQAARDGLEGSVFFALERTDVDEVLAASEIFVLPSDVEGIPLSLIEAMAAGRPVIATDVPGNADVIRAPEHGILVPPRNPDALAEAIERLLSDPDRAGAIGRAGQAHVRQKFDIRGTLARIEAIYDDALAKRLRTNGRKETWI